MDGCREAGEAADIVVVDEDAKPFVIRPGLFGELLGVEYLFVVDPVEKTDVFEGNVGVVFNPPADFPAVRIEVNRPSVRVDELRLFLFRQGDKFREMIGIHNIVVIHVGDVFRVDEAEAVVEGRGFAEVGAVMPFDSGIAERGDDVRHILPAVVHDEKAPISELLVDD